MIRQDGDKTQRRVTRGIGRHAPLCFCFLKLERGTNELRFRVVVDYAVAAFASPSGLLVSAERHRRIKYVVAVDPDGASAEFGSQAVRFLDVSRPHSRSETVNGVVGAS